TPKDVHLFNIDNEHTLSLFQKELKQGFPKERLLTFSSFNLSAQVHLRVGALTAEGLLISGHLKQIQGSATLRAFGRQTVVNLMAAATIAVALKIDPRKIFEQFAKIRFESWGRNQWIRPAKGPSIIFDGYN